MLNKLLTSKFYIRHRSAILVLIDLVIVNLSFLLAYLLKIDFDMNKLYSRLGNKLLVVSILASIDYAGFFILFKVHKSLWTYISIKEIFSIIKSVLCASVIFEIFVNIFYREADIITSIIIASIIIIVAMLGIRVLYRSIREYEYQKNGDHDSRDNALIVGAGDSGYLLLKSITKHKYYRSKVVGFIDDYKTDSIISGIEVLSGIADIKEQVIKHDIKKVFIAIPKLGVSKKRFIIDSLKDINCDIKIIRNSIDLLEVDEDTIGSKMRDIAIEDLLGRGEVKLSDYEIEEYIKDKVLLVTGAGGTIGGQLSREIIKFNPKKLYLLDINENGLYMLEQDFLRLKREKRISEEVEIYSEVLSIRDKMALDKFIGEIKPNVVYHAAAHKHVPLMETRPMEAIKNNIIGTRNLIDSCIDKGVERLIMISTDKAVNPTTAMGATKRITELILQSRRNDKTKLAAVRFGNVLGSNGSVIPIFKKQIEAGGPITVTSKDIVRYFMTVSEASKLVLQAGYYADNGDIFVLDMGKPVKILELAENMIRLAGFKPYEDIDIIEIGLRPGEKMFEELSWSGEDTVKTANNLIFKNHLQEVDRVKLDSVINELEKLAYSDKDVKTIKSAIMEAVNKNY